MLYSLGAHSLLLSSLEIIRLVRFCGLTHHRVLYNRVSVCRKMPDPDDKKDSKDQEKTKSNSSQSGQIGGFRDVPIDFSAGNYGDNKKNKNKNKGGTCGEKK